MSELGFKNTYLKLQTTENYKIPVQNYVLKELQLFEAHLQMILREYH